MVQQDSGVAPKHWIFGVLWIAQRMNLSACHDCHVSVFCSSSFHEKTTKVLKQSWRTDPTGWCGHRDTLNRCFSEQ